MSQGLDTFGCLGSTIKVAAGHYVDLANPDPASIEIESIAAALSKICRFGGHSPKFYSVAEHCVHATVRACNDGIQGDGAKAVLMHDAAEAYLGDMVKPLKIAIPQYGEAECRVESAIELAFGIDFGKWRDVIKRYDRAMLKAEKSTMWPEDTEIWAGFGEAAGPPAPLCFWGPAEAEREFLSLADVMGLVSP